MAHTKTGIQLKAVAFITCVIAKKHNDSVLIQSDQKI